jgi:hypothetical protein
MLYHCLKFLLINILLLLSIWIIAQQWYDEPTPQTGLQIIGITPVSNTMSSQDCLSIIPATIKVKRQAASLLGPINATRQYDKANTGSQKNVNCDDSTFVNHYLIWYQYQGQQYQMILNYQPGNDVPMTVHKEAKKGYF